MSKTFIYQPVNVCAVQMDIVYDPETMTILSYSALRGCRGHGQGMGRLLVGMKIDEAITRLEGIECPGSRNRLTSCPDQLAQALKAIKAQENR
ncbi:MAG: TIGR03905 family TSCPD domain-containing protein [Bacilli bacterium]|nr:TIGR03905 family TSCPD domain-containing protein [Bacilli bacterium]